MGAMHSQYVHVEKVQEALTKAAGQAHRRMQYISYGKTG
jgi:hypothetical protein